MAIKKKKKKEEFDASLMGGYLPGLQTPVDARAVISPHVQQTIADIPRTVTYLHEAPGEVLNYKIQNIGLAFWYYAIGSGPSQFAIQTPQAYGAYRLGLYPTFRVALAMELGVATAVFAALGTVLDPHRVWRAPFTEKVDPQFIDPQFVPEGMVHGGYL
jgi:hypothetical protein